MIPGASGSEITKIPPMDEVLRRHSGLSSLRRSGETEEEAVEEVLWHLARAIESRSEVRLREGLRAAHSWLGPDGQCASLAGSRGVFREKGLQGSVATHPRGDRCVPRRAPPVSGTTTTSTCSVMAPWSGAS